MRLARHKIREAAWAFVFLIGLVVVACGPPPTADGPEEESEPPSDNGSLAEENGEDRAEVTDDLPVQEAEPTATLVDDTETSLEVDAEGIPVGFTEDGYPFRGDPDAPIVIEEYSDFQCPYCARFYAETLPSLTRNQLADEEIVFIYRDYPLEAIHPQAISAANAARCAGEQGATAYWLMHDAIFENVNQWSNSNASQVFLDIGEQIGLDMGSFAPCVTAFRHEEAIREDIGAASRLGISSTPSFFINGQLLVGAQPLAVFEDAFTIINDGGKLASSEDQASRPQTQPSAAPTPASFRTEVAGALGDPDAPITIVEFTDYQCPYCARHSLQTLPSIVEELIDSGRVYYVLKDFPLDQLHPNARAAANAARCAGEQDAYWEMHDALFAEQAEWSNAGSDLTQIFSDLASEIELDLDQFARCVESDQFAEAVETDQAEGLSLGVNSTPFFFIDGYPLNGARPLEHFQIAVELAEEGRLAEIYVPREPEPAAQQPTGPVEVDIDGAYRIGKPDAPITIVEFTDFQCPFCARHYQQTYPKILQEFVEPGVVRYVFKDFPLSIHPQAPKAAEAARCAGEQEAFLAMHDMLFENQGEWSGQEPTEIFIGYASELGLDDDSFRECLTSDKYASSVEADLRQGSQLGITGTPAFFVNGYPVTGAQPFELFERAIQQLQAQENEE